MALKTRQHLVPSSRQYRGRGTNTRRYLTIHQTDNFNRGAGAQAHANLQHGGYRSASWHWQVDDKEAIQSYPESAIAWHAGDGERGTGNLESIGIEMCVNPDSDYEKAFRNTALLAAQRMKANKIPMSRLVQHNRWTGKNCPSVIRRRGEWARFRRLVQSHLDGSEPSKPKLGPKPAKLDEDGYWGAYTTGGLQYINKQEQDRVVSDQPRVNRVPQFTSGWEWKDHVTVGSLIIHTVQQYMARKGHYRGKIDGWAGPQFRAAMIRTYSGHSFQGAVRNMQKAINRQLGYK